MAGSPVEHLTWNPGVITPPVAEPTERPRFTLDGDDELEDQLAELCRAFLAGARLRLPDELIEGIALGGGYGRGEGGVLRTGGSDQPYNDLEFYIFLRGGDGWNRRRYGPRLRTLAEELGHDSGLDVEFKIMSLARLRQSPPSMFYYDLLRGHRWLLGDEGLFAGCQHHRLAKNIPFSEATRLLMNRCSGLLFAWDRLLQDPLPSADAEFIARNLAKAKLAFGDAVLTMQGQYHWSCRVRGQRVQALRLGEEPRWWPQVRDCHLAGVEFKLHPVANPAPPHRLRAELEALTTLGRQVWLWAEGRRLGRTFSSARGYAFGRLSKCPESDVAGNLLRNGRALGLKGLWPFRSLSHPRERIYHALALLLWVPSVVTDGWLRRRLQQELASSSTTFQGLVQDYQNLWRYCS